jgi:hypothetical protein
LRYSGLDAAIEMRSGTSSLAAQLSFGTGEQRGLLRSASSTYGGQMLSIITDGTTGVNLSPKAVAHERNISKLDVTFWYIFHVPFVGILAATFSSVST